MYSLKSISVNGWHYTDFTFMIFMSFFFEPKKKRKSKSWICEISENDKSKCNIEKKLHVLCGMYLDSPKMRFNTENTFYIRLFSFELLYLEFICQKLTKCMIEYIYWFWMLLSIQILELFCVTFTWWNSKLFHKENDEWWPPFFYNLE